MAEATAIVDSLTVEETSATETTLRLALTVVLTDVAGGSAEVTENDWAAWAVAA